MKVSDVRMEYRNGGEIWWRFRFGKGEGFKESLHLLKQEVPLGCREWDPRTKEWAINGYYAYRLDHIFENWRECLQAIQRTDNEH